jgi:hypothetical protein
MANPSSFHSLPTEILDRILAFVAPEVPDVSERSHKGEPPAMFLTSRSALCLMSSRLEALARPLLFKTIIIGEADSLLLLWRTFRCHPDLCRFVRQMAFWITLTRQSVVMMMNFAIKKKLESSVFSQDQTLYRTLVHGSVKYNMPQFIVVRHISPRFVYKFQQRQRI